MQESCNLRDDLFSDRDPKKSAVHTVQVQSVFRAQSKQNYVFVLLHLMYKLNEFEPFGRDDLEKPAQAVNKYIRG